MREIFINATKTATLHDAIAESIGLGQYGTLADDLRDCFEEEQIEQIEEILDISDLDELIDTILTDWSAESSEELMEDLTDILSEAGIELIFDDKEALTEDDDSYDEDDDFLGDEPVDDFDSAEEDEF